MNSTFFLWLVVNYGSTGIHHILLHTMHQVGAFLKLCNVKLHHSSENKNWQMFNNDSGSLTVVIEWCLYV